MSNIVGVGDSEIGSYIEQNEQNNELLDEDKDQSQFKPEPEKRRDGLDAKHIWAYSVGHFNNDLCASMWFIYLSYYLIYVVKLSSQIAALAILSG